MDFKHYNRDLVLVGGGHAHCIALRMLAMNPVPGLRVTLISVDSHTPYSGMLPGLIAGHYSFEETHIDLEALAFWADARFIRCRVNGIDPDQQRICFADERPDMRYDVISLDIGSAPDVEGVEGASRFAVPVKPVSDFYRHWCQFKKRILDTEGGQTVAIVGGGAGSIELVLAMRSQLQDEQLKFYLLAASSELLPAYTRSARQRVVAELEKQNIEIRIDYRVSKVQEGKLFSATGGELRVDEVFWCTDARATDWLKISALECDERGFVEVNSHLQSLSHPSVFAAGDVANFRENPSPKAGVYAVRQGSYLAKNLRRYFLGHALKSYRPQKNFLSLLSMGRKHAVANRAGFSVSGAWVWRWKDYIDRNFMERFQQLPEIKMSSADQKFDIQDMHCGGCGAKLPADMLRRVLSDVSKQNSPATSKAGLGSDDAAIIDVQGDNMLVQSMDVLRELVRDPFVMGRITANHALSDIYAMGAKPFTAQAFVSLPFGHERVQERDLRYLMAGAIQEFDTADCRLVGGHSLEGSELNFGFSVTGIATDKPLLLKEGLRCGDHLILCKPIGTGVLYAAQRKHSVDGRWLVAAEQMMLCSNAEAAEIAQDYSASACTDITGFGLLGHLSEMLTLSQLGVILNLNSLPLLPGVLECMAMGMESTMYEANKRIESLVENREEFRGRVSYPALFDPQTSGGLLFAVNPQNSDNCVRSLRARGYCQAAVIAKVTEGSILLE